MPKIAVLLGSLLICTGGCIAFFQAVQTYLDTTKATSVTPTAIVQPISQTGTSTKVITAPEKSISTSTPSTKNSNLVSPISNASSRITLKPFGIYVTPKNSPVSPERFTGYHTGTDFETLPDEQNIDVVISAMCDGKLLRAGTASGYGGYAVESCIVAGQNVTIVYGHLRATSISKKVGDSLKAGESFAKLGKGYSSETDGERKHLHLGIVKGKAVNIKGYVSSKEALKGWLDYQKLSLVQ